MDQPKQYEATIKFGATTPTDDPESPETIILDAKPVARDRIETLLPTFIGEIIQRPPIFCALKVGGRRAYDLARKGREVTLQPRNVRVYGIELLAYEWPFLRLRIDCGRGTYIRAIARDIGEALGVGGYLTELSRTRIGQFTLDDAVGLEQLTVESLPGKLKMI